MATKICVKCKSEFSSIAIIDGKRKNLQNRNYCLECSPWGLHNTKKIDKLENVSGEGKFCVRCNEIRPLSNFYSRGASKRYASFCKDCQNRYAMDRWIERKQESIRYKGGKCSKCGYDKNYSALVFHHRDPEKKDFDWNKLRLRSQKVITNELDKCDLLCRNCHAELHSPQAFINLFPDAPVA